MRWYYRALTEAYEAFADTQGKRAAPTLRQLRAVVDELDARAVPA